MDISNNKETSFLDKLYDLKSKTYSGIKQAPSAILNTYTNPNSAGYKYAYPLTGAAIGAGIGALMSKKKPLTGAAIGGGLGLLGGWKGGDFLKDNYFKSTPIPIINKNDINLEKLLIKSKKTPHNSKKEEIYFKNYRYV